MRSIYLFIGGQGEYYSTKVTISDPGRVCFIQNNRKPCLIQVEYSLTVLLLFPHCGAFAKSSPQELVLHSVSHVSTCLGLARITSANSDASQHSHRKHVQIAVGAHIFHFLFILVVLVTLSSFYLLWAQSGLSVVYEWFVWLFLISVIFTWKQF